ncbi:MAG: DUF4836 family protein [Bacteroidales bacterium]
MLGIFKKMSGPSVLLVALGLSLLNACTSTEQCMIPDDATFVMTYDTKTLCDKAKTANIANSKLVQHLKEQLGMSDNDSNEMVKLALACLKDPEESGISFKNEITFFSNYQSMYSACIMHLADKRKFVSNLELMFKEMNSSYELKENANLSYYTFDDINAPVIGWNDSTVCVLLKMPTYYLRDKDKAPSSEEYLKELFSLPKEKQLTNNEAYRAFLKDKKDIAMFFQFKGFAKSFEDLTKSNGFNGLIYGIAPILNVYSSVFEDFEDFCGVGNVSFNKNDITADYYYLKGSKKVSIDKYKILDSKFDEGLLKYVSESPKALLAYSFNVKNLLNFTTNIAKSSGQGAMLESDEIKKIISSISEGLGGNFALSFDGIQENGNAEPMPLVSLVFDIKDKDKILGLNMGIMTVEKMMESSKNEQGYYNIERRNLNIYAAINDDACIISNYENAVKTFMRDGYDKSLVDNDAIMPKLLSNNAFVFAQLNLADYYSLINPGSETKAVMDAWNNIAQTLEIAGNDKEASCVLKLNPNNEYENSLVALIKLVDYFAEGLDLDDEF